MEIWKDINEYKGYYQISNLGRVKSLARKVFSRRNNTFYCLAEKILRMECNGRGYSQCILSKNSRKKGYAIHKLVAIHFIPNLENKKCVNHKNGIKTDNRVENLEWVTYSENTIHAFSIGLMKKRTLLNESQVIEARKLRNEGIGYKELSRLYDVSYSVIECACKGIKGYSFVDYSICRNIHKVQRTKK